MTDHYEPSSNEELFYYELQRLAAAAERIAAALERADPGFWEYTFAFDEDDKVDMEADGWEVYGPLEVDNGIPMRRPRKDAPDA